LNAAASGLRITRLVLHEPPYGPDDEESKRGARELAENVRAALAEDRRADAIKLFLTVSGMPPEMVEGMSSDPKMHAVAPTMPYDFEVMGDISRGGTIPEDLVRAISVPTLVIAGGASPDFFLDTPPDRGGPAEREARGAGGSGPRRARRRGRTSGRGVLHHLILVNRPKTREDAMNAADRTERAERPADPKPRTSEGVRRGTGRDRDEWFALLDAWGAADRQYREIAAWLTGEHGVSKWWAQKLTVEYEQARGLRAPGVRPGGTFTVGASKTVAVPVERLFASFVDAKQRKRWLPGVALRKRASQPGRPARFDRDDATRIQVDFTAKGEAKSQAAVQHERLPDAQAAEEAKAYWRERLAALKALLES